MGRIHIGQGIDCVHLLGRQGLLRRVLHDKFPSIRLDQALCGVRVGVLVLEIEALGVAALALLQLVKRRQDEGTVKVGGSRAVDRAVDEGQVACGKSAV